MSVNNKRDRYNVIVLTIELPKDFSLTLRDTMEDEFKIACKKWEINLSEEDKANIMHHAYEQLKARITWLNIPETEWTEHDKTVSLRIRENGITTPVIITLPEDREKFDNLNKFVIRTHDGFAISEEPTETQIPMKDFPHYYIQEILQWARTAVFYGVSSYS